jgi:hypothetical protein
MSGKSIVNEQWDVAVEGRARFRLAHALRRGETYPELLPDNRHELFLRNES